MLGYSRPELLEIPWNRITHPDDRDADAARFDQLRRGALKSHHVEKRWLHKSGHVVWGLESVAVSGDLQDGSLQAICLVQESAGLPQDGSERQSSEQGAGRVGETVDGASLAAHAKMLEAERLAAVGQMVSGLAHESRNALQQIAACTEMLVMELAGSPEVLDLVAGVQEAEARLLRLFEDVRVFAIPLHLNRRKVDMREVWAPHWKRYGPRTRSAK